MKQTYVDRNFKPAALALIETANDIIEEYQNEGYVLTVRQLYYQLVARDVIANTLQEYKRVAGVFNDARLAGLMDWDAIEDRTREFLRRSRWRGGAHALESIASQFHMDLWDNQSTRPFVIVEKEALVSVFERVCRRYDVPVLAARGYPSVSVVREFVVNDMLDTLYRGQNILVLHFGDHDPSGIDMSRDLKDRFNLFLEGEMGNFDFKRMALNMEQIDELRPPENPAKVTDSRFDSYQRIYGSSSWELDALPPSYLERLVEDEVNSVIDDDAWATKRDEIDDIQTRIRKAAEGFE